MTAQTPIREPSAALPPRPRIVPAEDGSSPGASVPHVAIACFHDSAKTGDAFEAFARDRRLARARVEVSPGGIAGARAALESRPGPNLLIVESASAPDALLAELSALSEVCDEAMHVAVIGAHNDIALYRNLIASGVADYILAPPKPTALVDLAARLFAEETSASLGRVIAFIGAKGGSGSSTLARNVAAAIARRGGSEVLLVDLDCAFGSAAIGCDLEGAGGGVAEALRDAERLDGSLLEHLMRPHSDGLKVLAAPAHLGPDGAAPDPAAVERLIEVTRRNMPIVVLDLPHEWSTLAVAALRQADRVAVVTTPLLSALRNASMLLEALRALRPNDAAPVLVVNQVGAARRGEVPPDEIPKALDRAVDHLFPADAALFGHADFAGLMVSEQRGGGRGAPRVRAARRRWSLGRVFGT